VITARDGRLNLEQLEELGRLAQSRSPVFDTVTRPVPVAVSVARK
jgi:hypothetical protein